MEFEDNDDEIQVIEYWARQPGNPYRWFDKWTKVPALGLKFGTNYPALPQTETRLALIVAALKHLAIDQ